MILLENGVGLVPTFGASQRSTIRMAKEMADWRALIWAEMGSHSRKHVAQESRYQGLNRFESSSGYSIAQYDHGREEQSQWCFCCCESPTPLSAILYI